MTIYSDVSSIGNDWYAVGMFLSILFLVISQFLTEPVKDEKGNEQVKYTSTGLTGTIICSILIAIISILAINGNIIAKLYKKPTSTSV